MATFRTMSGQSFTLSSSISSTQTTILLSSFKVPVTLTNITMATMGTSVAYGTLAPGTSSAELISFTGITQNADGTATLTGVTRGLDKEYPYTEDSDFKQPHAGQTIFILSDAPQVFNSYPAKVNSETITGLWTFPQGGQASSALIGASYVAPLQDTEAVPKKYVDDIAIAGAPDATTSVKGIVELPTQAEAEAGTALGGTGASLVVTNAQYGARYISGYAVTTGTVNVYAVDLTPTPSALATGQVVGFNVTTANTGSATLNVDGLGAKNLLLGGTGLFAGALATSMLVGAQYDGNTNYNIIWRTQGESASATRNLLALRNTTGDVTVSTTPTASTDAISKSYGESMITTTRLAGYSPAADTVENTVFTTTVTGGLLNTNGMIRVKTPVSFTTSATAETWTIRLKYGGSTLATVSVSCGAIGGGSAVNSLGYIEAWIINNASLSSQNVGFYSMLSPNFSADPANDVAPTFTYAADTTSSIATSSNQTLAMTVQRSNGGGGAGSFFQTLVETIRA